MISDLLDLLDGKSIPTNDCLALPDYIVAFENVSAKWLATEDTSFESFNQYLVTTSDLDFPSIRMFLIEGFQNRPSLLRKIHDRFRKKINTEEMVQEIVLRYQLNEAFFQHIFLTSKCLNDLYSAKTIIHFPKPHGLSWPCQKIRLANRVILLMLVNLWDQDHSDEPILWKCCDRLVQISQTACEPVLAETINQLLTLGFSNYSMQQKDTLKEFFVQANDEKNKMLVDNLLLSKRSYDQLIEEGWQPDRWEIESLPMTVELFFEHFHKAGFLKVLEIGEELTINGEEVLSLYRYNGTPFKKKTDCKKVKVLAPGWSYQGEVVIQPKVRETK